MFSPVCTSSSHLPLVNTLGPEVSGGVRVIAVSSVEENPGRDFSPASSFRTGSGIVVVLQFRSASPPELLLDNPSVLLELWSQTKGPTRSSGSTNPSLKASRPPPAFVALDPPSPCLRAQLVEHVGILTPGPSRTPTANAPGPQEERNGASSSGKSIGSSSRSRYGAPSSKVFTIACETTQTRKATLPNGPELRQHLDCGMCSAEGVEMLETLFHVRECFRSLVHIGQAMAVFTRRSIIFQHTQFRSSWDGLLLSIRPVL